MGARTVAPDSILRYMYRYAIALLVIGGFTTGLLGCSGDTTGPAAGDLSRLYVALRLNQHAINLAVDPPYDTVRLTATALSAAGTALPSAGTIRFSVADSSVTIDSTGLLTAHFATPSVTVIALSTAYGVTHEDSANVQVTATPPAVSVARFTIQLPPGVDTNIAVTYNPGSQWLDSPVLTTVATNQAGNDTISGLLVRYSSSDPVVADVSSQVATSQLVKGQLYAGDIALTPTQIGRATITAETWAYGIAKRDSLTFVVGPPHFLTIQMLPKTPITSLTPIGTFNPEHYIVGIGAIVTWENDSVNTPIDVVFDDSGAVQEAETLGSGQLSLFSCSLGIADCSPTGAGNIPAFHADPATGPAFRSRSFPVAGTYTYHSRLYGTRGSIIVQ